VGDFADRASGSAKGGRSVLEGISPETVGTRVNIQNAWSGGGRPTVARTARPRDLRRTTNIGGKSLRKFVPELVDRFAYFLGLSRGYCRITRTRIDLPLFLLLQARGLLEPSACFSGKTRPFYEEGAYCMCGADALARGGGAHLS
jgi:hypothetical protein